MVRRINDSRSRRSSHNSRKTMSEMCNRKIKYGRNKVVESRNELHKRGLKESVSKRFARNLANKIADDAAKYFHGSTMEDIDNYMDDYLEDIIREYTAPPMNDDDCVKIIQQAECYNWKNAESLIGGMPITIDQLVYYAMKEALEMVDIYEFVKNRLKDMIDETEDDYA